jgi:hypothetical protein
VLAERVSAKSVAAEMQNNDRQDEDDDDGDAGEKHYEKEAGLVRGLLFDVSELLLHLLGKDLQVVRKLFRVMVLVFHVVLDAVDCADVK